MKHLDPFRQVFSNFGWSAAGEVAVRVIGVIIAVYLARLLGASLYGAIGFMLALVDIFGILIRSGTAIVGIRDIARSPDSVPAMHARITGLRLILAGISITLFWISAPLFAPWLSVPEVFVMLYGLLLLVPALTVAWALRGLERMDILAWGASVERLLVLGCILLLVTDAGDLVRIPVIEVCAGLLTAAWYRVYVSRGHGPLPVRFSPREWRGMAPETLPITLSFLLNMVYIHGDILLLGWLSDTANAGRFLAAQKLVLTFMVVSALLNRAAFPTTSRFMIDAPARALDLHAALYRYLMLLVIPVIVAGAVFSAPILELLFGASFGSAAPALILLLCTLPVVALTENLKFLLLSRGRSQQLMLGASLGACSHVLLAILLIPRWHIEGAAIACLAGETAGLSLLLYLTAKSCGGLPLRRVSAAPFAAGAAMAVVLAAGHSWEPVSRLAVAVSVYVAAATLLRTVSRREWRTAASFVSGILKRGAAPK